MPSMEVGRGEQSGNETIWDRSKQEYERYGFTPSQLEPVTD